MFISCDLCTGGPNCLNDCNIQAPGGCIAGDLRDDLPGKPYEQDPAEVTLDLIEDVMQNGYLEVDKDG